MNSIPIVEVVLSLERGGRRNRLLDNLRSIDRSLYSPIVCTLQPSPEDRLIEKQLHIPIHVIDRREGLDLRVVARLLDVIYRSDARLLHVHDGSSEFYGCLAGRVAQVPVVSTFHRSRDFEFSGKVRHWLCNRMLSARVAVSDARRRDLVEQVGSPPDRTLVILGAVDLERFRHSATIGQAERLSVREELGASASQPVLLSIGHYGEEKGHDVTLRALHRVVARVPEAVLWISGTGSDKDRQGLVRLSESLGLSGHVRFLGWRDDPQRLLHACDIFVQPSRVEAFGLVFAEASAVGRPVVSTRVGGIPEIVQDGVTGLLVPPVDPPALAAALEKLLLEPQWAQQMGEAGARVARERFSLDRMVNEYQDLFARVIGEWERERGQSFYWPLIQNGGQKLAGWAPFSVADRESARVQGAGKQGGHNP